MAFDPPLIDGDSIAGIYLRHADAMMLTSDGTAGGSRPGVRPGDTSLKVTLSGAGSTTINTAAGVASCSYPAQGVYRAYNQTSWTGTVTAAHATLDRIDLVYLRVWDNTVDSSGLAKADVVYLAGTPATTPLAPVPSGTLIYLPLATISVPSVSHGGSPAVTDARPCAVAPGGILIDAGATAGTYTGQYRDTGAGLQRWNGATTAWENALRLLIGGQVNIGGSSSGAAFAAILAAASSVLESSRVSGDTSNRFQVLADGTFAWGTGAAAQDTNLYRSAANTLTTDDNFTAAVTTSTTGLTAGSGFTVTNFFGYSTCGVYTVHTYMTKTGSALTADSAGNLTDTTMCTLPSGWRPPTTLNAIWGNGTTAGEATVDNTGVVTLRTATANGSITVSSNIRMTLTWVQ